MDVAILLLGKGNKATKVNKELYLEIGKWATGSFTGLNGITTLKSDHLTINKVSLP